MLALTFFIELPLPMYTPVTELPPALQERLADPGQLHLQSRCWKQESPSFSFRDQIEDAHVSSEDNRSYSQGKSLRIE